MEWLGLVLWAMVLGMAMPIAGDGAGNSGALGAQALLVLLGLVACVMYLALGHPRWPAWTSFGLALAAAVALARGVGDILADDPGSSSTANPAEERAGLLAGVELPLLLVVAGAMFLAATEVTTID